MSPLHLVLLAAPALTAPSLSLSHCKAFVLKCTGFPRRPSSALYHSHLDRRKTLPFSQCPSATPFHDAKPDNGGSFGDPLELLGAIAHLVLACWFAHLVFISASERVILEPTARVSIIASNASYGLRLTNLRRADRELQQELLAAIHDPYTSTPFAPGEDDLFDIVPAHLATHNQSPYRQGDPTLAAFFSNPVNDDSDSDVPQTPGTPTPAPRQLTPPPQQLPPANTTMATPTMPARGAHTAPKFDSTKPAELRRYFGDVEYLMDLAQITTTPEKKKAVSRYLSVQDQELFEGLEEFKEPTKTYEEFKKAVLKHYAGNDEDHLYTLKDWDAHLGSTARKGIHSETELANFYRQFVIMGKFLISKNRLSATEQSHAFLRSLQPASLQTAVKQRLQIIRPQPGTGSVLYSQITTAVAPAEPTVKSDPELKAILTSLTQLVTTALQAQIKSNSGAGPSTQNNNTGGFRSANCAYCEKPGHYIRECPDVTEDEKGGILKKNEEGRLVLPNGRYVPRNTEGKSMKERFWKWHELNPGMKVVPQMIVGLVNRLRSVPPTKAPAAPANLFVLTEEQRLESIAIEHDMLRTRLAAKKEKEAKADQTETPVTASEPPVIADQNEASPATPSTSHDSPATSNEATATNNNEEVRTSTAPKASEIVPPASTFPEHPYAAARDAAYAPPKDRNVGAIPKPQVRLPAPIHDAKNAQEMWDALMDADVTVKARCLLAMPEISNLAQNALNQRKSADKNVAVQLYGTDDNPFGSMGDLAAENVNSANNTRETAIFASLPGAVQDAAQSPTEKITEVFLNDPFVALFDQGRLPEGLITSAETKAIRCIMPIVDNQEYIESIVDPGSQICAMSEAVCHRLAIPYDPTIVLQMQSANGAITPSLGVARNVSFRLKNMTLYLQIHVVRNPAYDILLERPFDVLTQSIVHNYSNGDQTLTIQDPNTGNTITVPTIPRGSSRIAKEDFLFANHSQSKR
ncbi:hypothetical protein C8F01DRAFT_1267051 [Mycena amicta]|nr:hypothetical protein C8F01DRAFT_1267051 [Mycena amicta]